MTFELRVPAVPSAPALKLRPWTDDDVESLLEVYRDPVLRRWTRYQLDGPDDARRWLEEQQRGWVTGERFAFAVHETVLAAAAAAAAGAVEGRLVGHLLLKNRQPQDRSAEVGYWTAAYARGQGVAPRALGAVCAWAFEAFAAERLQRLHLLHQVDNPASCRVAAKAGFALMDILPARPPFPRDGHLHTRSA